MTGTRAQLYNGTMLLFTFFTSRLLFGTYQSYRVLSDFWQGLGSSPDITLRHLPSMIYASDSTTVPLWSFVAYLASNMTLNFLNFYWFYKMIAAMRKRFEPSPELITEARVDAKTIATGAAPQKQAARRRG